ncbi:response regulator transcription factor [Hamadaea sp. NPDC051192]|uniref:response regulator transcription factor n=1 Tax=Hamadaea sp. NPDC051192 TaxID=3154940 RepID=UPI003412D18E
MQTVLVCVRSAQAAQGVATCAQRLGVMPAVRTAVTAHDALTQLTTEPAEIILVDTALTRPDTVGFTRRALQVSPRATLVLFGLEDPQIARAAIEAGARGLIGGTDGDVVSAAAKALLLVIVRYATAPAARPPDPAWAARPTNGGPGVPGGTMRWPANGAPAAATRSVGLPTMVPAQRSDLPDDTRLPSPLRPTRSTTLTERELQVLRGMADGRSNAEIGRELFVSEDTVKTHARRLFRKLGARDRAHAVAAGFRAGLVN